MKRALALCVLFAGCADFEALGDEARCHSQLPGCSDAGAVDAGAVDAGVADAGVADAGAADADAGAADAGAADAGILDAGPPDAGEVDAGPPAVRVRLVPAWAATEGFAPTLSARGPSAVLAADAGHVMFFVSSAPLVQTNVPAGYVQGYVTLIDTATGLTRLNDGGLGVRSSDSVLNYVPSYVAALGARGPNAFVITSERLVDGGPAPLLDGGSLEPDGGGGIYGNGEAASYYSGVDLYRTVVTYLSAPLLANSQLRVGSTLTDALIGDAPDGSLLILQTSQGQSIKTELAPCRGLVNDTVTTITDVSGVADDRLVTLSPCDGQSGLSIASYSYNHPFVITPLGAAISSGRMAIAPEGTPRRAPFVAWRTTLTPSVQIARLDPNGAAIALSRPVVTSGFSPRVESMTVDDLNRPILILSTRFSEMVQFFDLPGQPVVSSSGLLIAGFDEDLHLRWVGPLTTTDDQLASSAATWVAGQLVIEAHCPQSLSTAPAPGGFCSKFIAAAALKVVLADGGSLP